MSKYVCTPVHASAAYPQAAGCLLCVLGIELRTKQVSIQEEALTAHDGKQVCAYGARYVKRIHGCASKSFRVVMVMMAYIEMLPQIMCTARK
jgi:hypothetical protein